MLYKAINSLEKKKNVLCTFHTQDIAWILTCNKPPEILEIDFILFPKMKRIILQRIREIMQAAVHDWIFSQTWNKVQ